jgi:hypothetical protein
MVVRDRRVSDATNARAVPTWVPPRGAGDYAAKSMSIPEENPPATSSPLSDGLYSSAVAFAQSALRAFLDKDFPTFLLHAGTALEHLVKAYLASLNESFVAANDFDSLIAGLRTRN